MSHQADAYAIVLAGGRGERFWPLSTAKRPKQLLSLVGDKPLLVAAVERLEGLVPRDRILVVTNADLAAACRRLLTALPKANIIGEPVGRDTAVAVALGVAVARTQNPRAVCAVVTADHIIGDLPVFQRTLRALFARAAATPALLTIGFKPLFPATGFGYIETDARAPEAGEFVRVRRFVEKPDLDRARQFMTAGTYYWNSGMFVWSAETFVAGLRRHCPHLAEWMERIAPAIGTRRFVAALKAAYATLPKISIDYALLEKADNIEMTPGAFAWDDVGSWTAIEGHFPKDAAGNVTVGCGEYLDAAGNIVVAGKRLTALLGVRNLVVVQAPGATLICSKDRVQDVRKLVAQLKRDGRHDRLL